tara:strand:+ start:8077 stop:8532 length:456 start_codon:yes stop_codon:yes gene_type:complete
MGVDGIFDGVGTRTEEGQVTTDVPVVDGDRLTKEQNKSTLKIFLKNLGKLPFRLIATFLEGVSVAVVFLIVLAVVTIIFAFIGSLLFAIWAAIGGALGAIVPLVACVLTIIPAICVISDLVDYKWFEEKQRKMFINYVVAEIKEDAKKENE